MCIKLEHIIENKHYDNYVWRLHYNMVRAIHYPVIYNVYRSKQLEIINLFIMLIY